MTSCGRVFVPPGAQVQGWILRRRGKREQCGKEGHHLRQGQCTRSQHDVQLLQLGVRGFVRGQGQVPLQRGNQGVERAVLMGGRTTPHDLGRGGPDAVVPQLLHQTGFANAGFPAEQHHLAEPVLALRPAVAEQGHVGLPSHQRRQPAHCRHLETALGRTLAEDPVARQAVVPWGGLGQR
jgi:hypothetical protein